MNDNAKPKFLIENLTLLLQYVKDLETNRAELLIDNTRLAQQTAGQWVRRIEYNKATDATLFAEAKIKDLEQALEKAELENARLRGVPEHAAWVNRIEYDVVSQQSKRNAQRVIELQQALDEKRVEFGDKRKELDATIMQLRDANAVLARTDSSLTIRLAQVVELQELLKINGRKQAALERVNKDLEEDLQEAKAIAAELDETRENRIAELEATVKYQAETIRVSQEKKIKKPRFTRK